VLYMLIEDYRDGDPVPIYRRLQLEGRLMPDGLAFVSSWVTTDLTRCYQVVECEDRASLDDWISRWSDLVSFEVVPVITSEEASASITHGL
jgi:hypothetical protein